MVSCVVTQTLTHLLQTTVCVSAHTKYDSDPHNSDPHKIWVKAQAHVGAHCFFVWILSLAALCEVHCSESVDYTEDVGSKGVIH